MLRACNEKRRGTRISGKIAKTPGSALNRIFGSEKEKKDKRESQGRANKEKAKEESKENMDGEVEQKKSRVDAKTLMGRSRNESPRRMQAGYEINVARKGYSTAGSRLKFQKKPPANKRSCCER